MYRLVFGRPANFTVLYEGSIFDCMKHRAMSGDLIVDDSNRVVKTTAWMFPWEQKDENCYARRMQRMGWKY